MVTIPKDPATTVPAEPGYARGIVAFLVGILGVAVTYGIALVVLDRGAPNAWGVTLLLLVVIGTVSGTIVLGVKAGDVLGRLAVAIGILQLPCIACCGCVTFCSWTGLTCSTLPNGLAVIGASAIRTRTGERWAHHPDHADFREDVFRAFGRRWCVGCFTVYPAFALGLVGLALAPSVTGPWLLVPGVALAGTQLVSSFGKARRRAAKVAVKSAFGLGLASLTWATLSSPLTGTAKAAVLIGLLTLANLSALPRARRLRRWLEAQPQIMSGSQHGLSQWQRGHS